MNFFTSSSRFLFVFIFLIVSFLFISVASKIYVDDQDILKDNDLLFNVQIKKIDREKDVEIAFVGDSSLGNAIDAKLVEKITGKKTANFALTGMFGYSGTVNMAQQVYQKNKATLKYIVIMQAMDVAGRKIYWPMYRQTKCLGCEEGIQYLARDTKDKADFLEYINAVADVFINKNYIEFRIKDIIKVKILKGQLGDKPGPMYDPEVDYYRQSPPQKISQAEIEELAASKIDPRNLGYLENLSQFCKDKNITCIYAHGPLYDKLLQRMEPYKENLSSEILARLKQKPIDPYPLKRNQVGDTVYHTRPDSKQKTTRYYTDRLFP